MIDHLASLLLGVAYKGVLYAELLPVPTCILRWFCFHNFNLLPLFQLFGFLNFGLWLASLWFLFKETKWHKERMESTENFDQPQAEAQTGGDSSYQAPTY